MKFDAEFWELLSGCLRIFLFGLTGQIMILILCDKMLVRRRSLCPLFVCLSLKTIFSTILVGTVLQYYYPEELWVRLLGVLSSTLTVLLCCIPFIWSFYGGVVKCLVAENICETVVSVLICPGFILFSYLEGREDVFAVYGKLQMGDYVFYVLMLLAAVAVSHLAAPLMVKYRTYRIRRKKAAAAVFIVYFGVLQIMGISDMQDGQAITLWFYLVFLIYATVGLIVFVLVYLYHKRHVKMEHTFLNMQLHLMESHYSLVQNQLQKMDNCRRLVDDQMKEIEERKYFPRGKAEAYLEQLKKTYEEIRSGMYCDDWKVEALLYCQSETARSQGIEVAYELAEYNRGRLREDELVHILFRLFEYGIKANQMAEREKEKKINLRMGGVLNQLVIEFSTTAENKKLPSRKQVRKCVREYHGNLLTEKEQNGLKFIISLNR